MALDPEVEAAVEAWRERDRDAGLPGTLSDPEALAALARIVTGIDVRPGRGNAPAGTGAPPRRAHASEHRHGSG